MAIFLFLSMFTLFSIDSKFAKANKLNKKLAILGFILGAIGVYIFYRNL